MSGPRAASYSQSDIRAFRIQMVVAFLMTAAVAGTRPTTTYRALSLGADTFQVGIVQSAWSVLPALTAVIIGRWIDRRGEGRTYFAGLVALSIGSVLSALAWDIPTLAFAQAVVGFGTIMSLVSGQASITGRAHPEDWNKRFGSYSACLSLGQLVGPSLAAAIQESPLFGPESERWVFVVTAISSLVAAVLTLAMAPAPRQTPGSNPEASGGFLAAILRVLRRPGMYAAMFVSIAVASTVDVLAAYLPIYGTVRGLSVGLVGGLLSIRAGATMASRLMMDYTLRRLGWERAMVICLVISALMLALIPTTAFPPALVGVVILLGLTIGLLQPMTVTWIANRAAPGERGTALAVRLTGNRGSLLFIPAIMGAVAGAAGVSAVFWILAALLGVGSVVGRKAHAESPVPAITTDRAGDPAPSARETAHPTSDALP